MAFSTISELTEEPSEVKEFLDIKYALNELYFHWII